MTPTTQNNISKWNRIGTNYNYYFFKNSVQGDLFFYCVSFAGVGEGNYLGKRDEMCASGEMSDC